MQTPPKRILWTGASGAGLGGLSWAADHFDWKIPDWFAYGVLAISVALILYAVIVGLISFARWLRTQGTKNADKTENRDTSLLKVLYRLHLGCWSDEKPDSLWNDSSTGPFEYIHWLNEIKQAALDEDIRIWGRPGHGNPLIQIEKGYWSGADFSIQRLDDEYDIYCDYPSISDNSKLTNHHHIYYDLMLSKQEVDKKWPVGNT